MTAINASQQVQAIGNSLLTRAWTITCAESCTGGGLAHAFTAVSGSSAWFNLGWVTYSNEAKHRQLGVSHEILTNYGAVSEETVTAMAVGAARAAHANVAVAISGIAGPGGGSTDKPVGLVWFGFWIDGKNVNVKQIFVGDRTQVREQAVNFALAYLYQQLVEKE